MSLTSTKNPAEEAAQAALDAVYRCITERKSFILEAGAGAGKTYSLIKSLEFLLKNSGPELRRRQQKIACITFTNVAKNEIESRTDKNPIIHSDTIHAFCWSLIRNFQPELRVALPSIGKWAERMTVTEVTDLGLREVVYDLGYPSIEEHQINLYHDDVLDLIVTLLEKPKFRTFFLSQYPVLFIDEYQDTNKKFADAIQRHFLGKDEPILIGFFGDHWQKIYGDGCGKIEHESLDIIEKNSNFRSVPAVVNVLNALRQELPQEVKDPDAAGTAAAYHTNNWAGVRRTGAHWNGDVSSEAAHAYLLNLRTNLITQGWDFDPTKTKILMLTHNVLAEEQGYKNFADVFERNESFIKKEDKYVAYFVDTLEPLCAAYENKKFGDMFTVLGGRKPLMITHQDKIKWSESMNGLIALRHTGTIGQIVEYIRDKKYPRLPEVLERKEKEFEDFVLEDGAEEPKSIGRLRALKKIMYKEVISFAQFSNAYTPFATKHSVKGAEFENVLIVLGRGWSQYNFDQMLTWMNTTVPVDKIDTFERSRNLFYVCSSRPKKRLALLFTQKLEDYSLGALSTLFGSEVHALPNI
ncbi:MAG: helicase [Parcubacteria group bacterium]|nr:helicase [Parcubacteria group bacterium]